MNRRGGALRLALPSDRMMEGDTLAFMEKCGLAVRRASSRQYVGKIASVPGVEALFQRSVDIPRELDAGDVDMAIIGYERYLEDRDEDGDSVVALETLGYSHTDLVVAAPNSWEDVRTMADLAARAERTATGAPLRVATKYHRQVGRFLDKHGVRHRLVHINGAIEAAPMIGTADVVSDLASSGATLRENNLRPLDDGIITRSSACMVANRRALRGSPEKLAAAKTVLELIEARLRAEGYYNIIANIEGDSMESVAALVNRNPAVSGMQGPTAANVFSKDGGSWFAVSVVVEISQLTAGVDYLREIGASGVVVTPAYYVFDQDCRAFERLREAVGAAEATA